MGTFLLAKELFFKYLPHIIGAVAVIGSLWYLHHSIYTEGYTDAQTAYEERDAKTAAKGAELLADKEREVRKLNIQLIERTQNANKIKEIHAEELATYRHAQPSRMPVNTAKASSCVNTMPGSVIGSGIGKSGNVETATAELSEAATREFNKVVDKIEKMQLNCEALLNKIPEE